MKNLRNLLERFSKSLSKDTLTKDSVIEVIKKLTGITLQEGNISLKEGILEITAGATLKNELRLKEEGFKSELKDAHHLSISKIIYK